MLLAYSIVMDTPDRDFSCCQRISLSLVLCSFFSIFLVLWSFLSIVMDTPDRDLSSCQRMLFFVLSFYGPFLHSIVMDTPDRDRAAEERFLLDQMQVCVWVCAGACVCGCVRECGGLELNGPFPLLSTSSLTVYLCLSLSLSLSLIAGACVRVCVFCVYFV